MEPNGRDVSYDLQLPSDDEVSRHPPTLSIYPTLVGAHKRARPVRSWIKSSEVRVSEHAATDVLGCPSPTTVVYMQFLPTEYTAS